jgi:eukaryotic-like serine/threonine-protein kinase
MAADTDRHLLFGLIALQVGLIDQAQLVAAFQAWARDKTRSLADHLSDRGSLGADGRAAVEAMAAVHVKQHGGDAEQSLAAIPAGRATREELAALGDPDVTVTIAKFASGSTERQTDQGRTTTDAVGTDTSDGQRFQILRPHARGGLGAVFVAVDAELHREVALKQILERHADDPASRHRFLMEAEITGGLEHPGIVPVYGLGTHADGRPYYAMRFIRGESLKEAIDRFHNDEALKKESGRRSFELRKLLRRFIDVCNAIDYAHSRGVLHRDLKPGNVVLGTHGETLVVDWGLAKLLGRVDPGSRLDERTLVPSSASGSSETLPGSALGTPGYMCPEQARGDLERLAPRSDVYSLGATLYCLLAGQPPFEGDDVEQVLAKVKWGEFTRPRHLKRWIDPALEAVCLKAMAFMPEDRYQSARALADDIERWTAGQPVTAWDEPLPRRIRRWTRRAAPAATLAMLAGVIGLAVVAGMQSARIARLRLASAAVDQALHDSRAATNQANLALGESQEWRKRAEAAGRFLTGAFRRSGPTEDGRELKAASLLDRAAGDLGKDQTIPNATRDALQLALGEAYLGLGISEKAEPLLQKVYESLKAGEAEVSASPRKLLADAGARIVALYEAWGDSERANQWRKRLEEAVETNRPKP